MAAREEGPRLAGEPWGCGGTRPFPACPLKILMVCRPLQVLGAQVGGGLCLFFFNRLFSSVRDNLPFSNRPRAWTVIISILWIRKLRHREARTCPRLCTGEGWDSSPRAKEFLGLHSSGCTGEGQRWDSNPGEELLGLHAHPCVVSPHPGP